MGQLLMVLPSLAAAAARWEGEAGAWPGMRRASRADGPALAELLARAFGEPWATERVDAELFLDPTVDATFVLDTGAGLVSCASSRRLPHRFPGHGYLHWVAGDPALPGRGLGRAVVLRVLAHMSDQGLTAAVLETDDPRLPAIATYLGLGFVPARHDADDDARWAAVARNLGRPLPDAVPAPVDSAHDEARS